MEISVGMTENNSTHRESQRCGASAFLILGSAGYQPVLSGSLPKSSSNVRCTGILAMRCDVLQAAEDNMLAACAPQSDILLARRSDRFCLRARGLEAKNCFAFLHQIKAIAGDRFEVTNVRLEQIDLARLPRQQGLLLVHLLLEVVDLSAALH